MGFKSFGSRNVYIANSCFVFLKIIFPNTPRTLLKLPDKMLTGDHTTHTP